MKSLHTRFITLTLSLILINTPFIVLAQDAGELSRGVLTSEKIITIPTRPFNGIQHPLERPLPPDDPRAKLDPNLLNVLPIQPPKQKKHSAELPSALAERGVNYDQVTGLISYDVEQSGLPSNQYQDERFVLGNLGPNPRNDSEDNYFINPNIVIGEDNRVPINDTTVFPWRTITKLYMTFPNSSLLYGCTGTLISSKNVLTAGHCLYDEGKGGWATSIRVVPGLNNTYKPYGEALSIRLRAVDGWIVYEDYDYDYGLITLDRHIGYSTGWLGYEHIANINNIIGYLSGYPGDRDNGLRQYFHSGPIEDSTNHLVYYTIDTFGGQSGSGVYRVQAENRFVFAIHSGPDASGAQRNRGTRITSNKFDQIRNWITADNLEGYLEFIDCNQIRGWAADRNRLNTSISVDIFDVHGSVVDVYTVVANQSRPDVGSYLGDNGLHGFNFTFPSRLATGGHTISVKVAGINLSNSPRSISCTDTVAPNVTITSPTSNSTYNTNNNSLTLGGTASNNVTRVTWTNSRGGNGTASGTTSWTASGIALQSGTNELTVRAQDAAGNIGADILTVTYTPTTSDTSSPTVEITSPTTNSNYSTSGSTLTLRGNALDNGVTQVTWTNNRGGNGTANGTTNWTANVTSLQSGTNVLTVRARDAAGNTGIDTLTVTYTPPPQCGDGSSVNYRINGGPPIHPDGTLIKGQSSTTTYVLRNGQRRGIPSQSILNNLYSQQNGGFDFKDIITVATDELNRYPEGAVVNSSLPSNGRSQPDGRLIQRVGGSEISIVSNGVRRPFTSESSFLGLGYLYCNVLPASDYDFYPVGSPADAITNLYISSVTPNSLQTRDWGGSVTYTFTVVDGNGTPVSGAVVGGGDSLRGIVFLATFSTDGNGQGTYTTTVPNGSANGIYDIIFLAEKSGYTKSEGVTRQLQVSHFQDTSPPSVAITSPTSSPTYNTSSNSLTLGGTSSDNVGVTQVSWSNDRGGSGTASGATNWIASGIPLQSGANVLTVAAQDAAGNVGTTYLSVTYSPAPQDTISPSLAITSHGDGQVVTTSSITVSGTAADGGLGDSGISSVTVNGVRASGDIASGPGTAFWSRTITLSQGANTVTVVARDNSTNQNSTTQSITITYEPSQTPFHGIPFAVPTLIQAEDYDNGGEGVAYHDEDVGNNGGHYRANDVDIRTADVANYAVFNARAGEWLEYTINVAAAGNYTIEANVASRSAGGTFHIEIDGVDVTGVLTAPTTGAWTVFRPVGRSGIALSAGQHILRLALDSNGVETVTGDFDSISITQTSVPLQYYPLPRPIRLLDTRTGEPACDNPSVPLAAGVSRTQNARVTCDGITIPANAQAIVGNATVVNNTGAAGGFVTLYPSGATRPTVSNLNYSPGQIVPNAFTVGLGSSDGAFNIYATSGVNFIVDITGYYAPPGTGGLFYHPLPNPVRLLDTRAGEPACATPATPLTGGATRIELARTACTGIPASAQAIVGNATVVNTEPGAGSGFVTLFPSGAARPTVSNLNYVAGQIVPNAFTVGLGSSDGAFQIFAQTSTHFIVDITGYYSDQATDANGAGLLYNPLPNPVRLLDTRPGEPACVIPGTPLTGGGTRTEPARIACAGIPSSAQAIVGNATVVSTVGGSGFITLYPSGATRPTVSNLNFVAGQIVPNAFTVGIGGDGAFNIFASTSTHFIADLTGYFAP